MPHSWTEGSKSPENVMLPPNIPMFSVGFEIWGGGISGGEQILTLVPWGGIFRIWEGI